MPTTWQTRINWVTGEPVGATDLNAPGNDLRKWGGNVDANSYDLSNAGSIACASLTAATITGPVAQDAWTTLPLLNSWVYFGSGQQPQYRRDKQGRVWFRGLIKNGTFANGTPIAGPLPSICWPASGDQHVMAYAHGAAAYVFLAGVDGKLYCENFAGNSYLLLNFSFPID